MDHDNKKPLYLAYMLRLWQEKSEEGVTWRATLESPHTGERRGFASLEALVAFLMEIAISSQTRRSETHE